MKQFSKHWKKSKNRRKKRKYVANAPSHIKHKFLSSNLNKELRKKYGRRNFPLRSGDEVKVMRGEFKDKKGKIDNVDRKGSKVTIEKVQKEKGDGTKIPVSFDPSNLQIQSLNLDDRERERKLKGKKKGKKKSGKLGKDKPTKSKGKKSKKPAKSDKNKSTK